MSLLSGEMETKSIKYRKEPGGAGKRTQWVEALAAKPGGMSSSHETHTGQRELTLTTCLLVPGEPVSYGLREDFSLGRAFCR